MLYTGKGDDGTTYFFGSKERFGKDTPLVEALGTCDELCSFLGYLRAKIPADSAIIEDLQQNIFIIQAELAGADKQIVEEKVRAMEAKINDIEKTLPPITTFFVPGANENSALYDMARTLSRRAERRVVALGEKAPSKWTLAYLNRLSSLLYAMARKHGGGDETKPHYA